ncbi:MAG: signal peptidase II [Planctomycetes bacterium]|nr:signal peptidase II [Planctomycetota bacterium]
METGKQDRIARDAPLVRRIGGCKVELPDTLGHLIFWPLLLLGLAVDLWTKHVVFAWLRDEPQQSAEIIKGFLSFRLALNSGAAFGVFSGRFSLLAGVAVVALVLILGVFLLGSARQRLVQVALALFGAGVCGNLWDRLFNDGHVRDFIDVVYWPGRHWHTFNVADAWLCIAVGVLLLATFLTGSSDRTHAPPQK